MGSNPAAPTIIPLENKDKSPPGDSAAGAEKGTERRRSAGIGTESPEIVPNAVQQAFCAESFDWHDPCVICQEQPRSAVYTNPMGQLVIRQERGPLSEEDPWVYFNRESVPALINALKRIIEEE